MYQRPATSGASGVLSPGPDAHRRGLGSDSRFAANGFQYNGRVAAGLLPCILVLLGAGGTPVAGTLVVGLMLSYILDALQYRQGAFLCIWVSLFATAFSLAFSGVGFGPHVPVILSLLILFTSTHLVFLCGVWISLQFKWLQLEQPTVVVALERLLFACIPFTAGAIQTWGVVAAVGVAQSPFYLMPILFELYWLYSLPRTSSFRAAGDRRSYGAFGSEESNILGPMEESVHTTLLLFLPLIFHTAVHHSRLLSSWSELCDLLLLFFVPLLFLLFATTRGALSWLYKEQRQLQQLRVVNGAVALAVIVGCLEIRVVFVSFGRYISLPPPLNYVLVTLALYGGALAGAAYIFGLVRGAANNALGTGVLVVAAVAGSLVLGMPLQIVPAPAIAAVYLAQFCTAGGVTAYFIFTAASALSAAWFLMHNFWFLDATLGGLPLKTVCQLLIASIVLAMAVPGVSLINKAQPVAGAVLIAQAALVCKLENRLYNFGHDEEGLYPSYLVVLTTLAGFLAARRLQADARIGQWAAWLASCLYLAKLPMLLLTSPNVVWASALLLLVVSPPLLLYRSSGEKGKASGGGGRMKAWQGVLHAASVFAAVWLCRYTLFDAILWGTGHRPSGGLLVGALLLVASAACVPIVALHFSHVQAARRAMTLGIVAGILFVLLQPPLLPAWNAFWDADHMPDTTDADDAKIYGASLHGPAWPSWLLLAAVMGTVAALSSAIPIVQVPNLRLGFALALGTTLGVYLCAEYFARAPLIHALLIAAVTSATVFIIFAFYPASWSPLALPLLFALQVALLPAMWLAEGFHKEVVELETEWSPEYSDISPHVDGVRNSLVGMYCALFMLIALVVKVKLSSAGAEKTAGGGGGGPHLPHHSAFTPQHRNIQKRTNFLKSLNFKKAGGETAWLPAIGNAATLLCFALALLLNATVTGGSDRSIFFIVPVLLLLNQDASTLAGFTDRQRYFPLTVAISGYLACAALYRLYEEIHLGLQVSGWQVPTGGASTMFVAKNLALLLLTLPNHAFFNRFMWDYAKQSDYVLLLITPLNLPATVLADIMAVRALSFLGIAYAIGQYLVSRHVRLAGNKFI